MSKSSSEECGERSQLLVLGIGDRAQQGVCALARVQSRVLNNDWNVRLNCAGVVGITRNGLRLLEIVKSEMLCSSRCHHHRVRTGRVAVRKENSDFDMSVLR